MVVKKKFIFENIEFRIVLREEAYMNGCNVEVLRVIAPNGNCVPVQLKHKQTLKSIVNDCVILFNSVIESKGIDYFINEIS